ncbi:MULTISPECIES: family 16 glycoside hydrolase [unclassified Arthrobacter]|uniref:family 16 glycoside hydrolase n=1 Tax=unclassified Arthrobacter TaxID=235627 RepID=UPI001C85C76B|nr:family 16 glycoside hydrolase [Arthrobacter sp. MAHUQ-56]MBX7444595.1 DUF1080 domain-containing protein [Arthrobacter sp. MAHUQ-56]
MARAIEATAVDPVAQLINLKGADVDAAAKNRNGLTFKGFGVLSANSTSSLLMDYKAQQPKKYWELIETLFGGDHPIMSTIKIEMGNDRNTSTGPNAATMRSRDEYPNVQREPGFQLAADAQSVAHGDLQVSLLRWSRPAWVTSDATQYIWFKNTVLAAYREYGVMVGSINPDTNETGSPNVELYKTFSGWVSADTAGYEGATADDPNNGFKSDKEKSLYQAIKTVAGDTVSTPPTSFGDQLTSPTDSSLRDAVDAVGFHYATADDANGNMKKLAETYDKEVWNSEGQATFSNSADRPNNTSADGQGGTGTKFGGTGGPLEMSNWVTTGFSKSRRTLNIFQPAIGSFYDGFQYSSKELVSARDPWSGWLYYDGGLAAIEQFTQFAKLGWENADNTAGIWRGIPQASGSALGGGNPPSGAQTGAASYTTLASPDKSDFSTVIVNDSAFTKTYKITATDLNLGADSTMELWETRAADAGQKYDANYVVPVQEVAPDGSGTYTVTIKPWSTLTATTLDHATRNADGTLTAKDGYGPKLPTSPEYTNPNGGRDVLDTDASGNTNGAVDDKFLYADDFNYKEEANILAYDPKTGALSPSDQTYLDSRGSKAKPAGTPNVQPEDDGATPRYTNDTNGAFESVATDDPAHGRVLRQQVGPGMAGGAWNGGDPKTTIGDYRWANYKASVDVRFDDGTGQYATIGAREQGGSGNGQNVSAAELKVEPTGAWSLLRYGSVVASGTATDKPATNFRAGPNSWNNIAVQVAGNVYTAYINGVEVTSYTDTAPQATGRIQLGSAFTITQFDNLKIEKVPGYTAYYTQVIDGMHQTSWDNNSTPVLKFNDKWSHANGQGMYEWQRTASKSTGKGAALTCTFTGTGLDVIGNNPGTAKLNVTVDGIRIASNAPTWQAGSERTTFTLRGLENTEHTVVLETATDDAINVDAVGVIKANADAAAVDTTGLQTQIATAKALNEADWSTATWAPLADILADAQKAVANPAGYGLDTEGATALAARLAVAGTQLVPKDVSPDVRDLGVLSVTAGGALPKTVTIDGVETAVVWDTSAAPTVAGAKELASVQVTGRTEQKLPSTGLYQRFSAAALLTPADLAYFIDSGSGDAGTGSAYAAVKAAQPGLSNAVADQKWNGSDAGTTWGYSTASTAAPVPGSSTDWGSSYLSANYNQPIDYHLSLPAGTYNIVAVQAPRANTTTNIYSTVTSGSYQNKVTATSTGAATPITQKITLTDPAVVNVSFGTNGTSGYNARMALLYVQAVPRDLGFLGTLTTDADLPTTVTVDGKSAPVTWDKDSAAQQRTDYKPLVLKGTIGDSQARQPIVARYEVVPAQLSYYIDSGTNGADSPQFTSVKNSRTTLLNDKSDQASQGADQWGYVADGMKVKAGTDLADKYSTGLYQDTTQLIYRLPLSAGTYALTAGFTEWWNLARTLNHTVSVAGEELAKGNIPLSGTNSPLSGDLKFTLTQPATVEYRVTNEGAGSEKPVISWLAVAKLTDMSGLQTAVDSASTLRADDYTPESWSPFAAALEGARTILGKPSTLQDKVDAATQALSQARAALVKAIPVTVTTQYKCVANKAVLMITAENKNDLPVTVTLNSPIGTKTFDDIPSGKSRTHPFNTLASSVSAGSVEVVLTGAVDGKTTTQKRSVAYPAYTC